MAITDHFGGNHQNAINPAEDGFPITPSNDDDLTEMTRGIMVGVSGDVSVVMKGGTTLTLPALAAGVIHPVRVSRVRATGTTASGIVGFV